MQLGRKVFDPPVMPGRLEIVQDIARRLGLDWNYSSPSEIFDEMVPLMPDYANLTHDNLGPYGKLYPIEDPDHSDGTVVLFDERFNTADGSPTWCRRSGCRARSCPARSSRSCSIPDDCWSTGTPGR